MLITTIIFAVGVLTYVIVSDVKQHNRHMEILKKDWQAKKYSRVPTVEELEERFNKEMDKRREDWIKLWEDWTKRNENK